MHLFGRVETASKQYLAGTHRSRTPSETLNLYMPLMDRCGITRLANLTGLDCLGIPVYSSIQPLSRSLSMALGKGIDNASAKASALMESLEVWHAENVVLPLRYDSQRALSRGARVLDTEALPTRSDAQPDPDRPTFWVQGWELFLEEPVWVPFELVHLNFVKPVKSWSVYEDGDSNGLASGNCLLEAAIHGLCELIERDATVLWFQDPGEASDKQTQIDLATVDPQNRALIERIEAAGLLLGVFDATSDIGIPSYNAVLFDHPGSARPMGYFWGFGCHLDPRVALSRAVTETIQARCAEIGAPREDVDPQAFTQNRDEKELAEMRAELLSPPPTRRFDARVSLATDSFEADLEIIREGLRNAGIKSGALVNLSHPDIGLSVVKSIVPELEGLFYTSTYKPRERSRRRMAQR